MDRNLTLEIETQFQDAFTRVFEDQIQQLIEDSRKEALAQAKQILRENALNNVLKAVVGSTVEQTAKTEPPAPVQKPAKAVPAVAPAQKNKAPEAKAVLKQTETSSMPGQKSDVIEIVSVKTVVKPKARVSDQPARVNVKPVKVQNMKTSQVSDPNNAPPVLNDRILEEIEAIREQIQRNELLLSQIKPFVQATKVQEE